MPLKTVPPYESSRLERLPDFTGTDWHCFGTTIETTVINAPSVARIAAYCRARSLSYEIDPGASWVILGSSLVIARRGLEANDE